MSTEPAIDAVSTQLAYDLASGLWEKDIVLAKHGVDKKRWNVLRTNPKFREIMEEALQYWTGKDGQDRRIRAKAKLMLEESLPALYRIANVAPDVPPSAQLAAIAQMEKLSGMDAKEAVGPTGPMFNIQINLGSDTLSISGNNANYKANATDTIGYDEDADYVEDEFEG